MVTIRFICEQSITTKQTEVNLCKQRHNPISYLLIMIPMMNNFPSWDSQSMWWNWQHWLVEGGSLWQSHLSAAGCRSFKHYRRPFIKWRSFKFLMSFQLLEMRLSVEEKYSLVKLNILHHMLAWLIIKFNNTFFLLWVYTSQYRQAQASCLA